LCFLGDWPSCRPLHQLELQESVVKPLTMAHGSLLDLLTAAIEHPIDQVITRYATGLVDRAKGST